DLPGPKKGFSSHLISPDPVKGLLLHVRVFGVFHKKVHRILTEGIAAADHRIFVLNLLWNLTTMLKLVRKHVGGGVVFAVLHVAASLNHQGFHTQITKFLRCPTPTDPRTDYNSLICSFLFTL